MAETVLEEEKKPVYDKFDTHYRGVIEQACPLVEDGGYQWRDMSEARVYDAVRYLRIRGLIITHPSNVLVRFK